jgi:ABC-type lipoprotein export system ATPase subunit
MMEQEQTHKNGQAASALDITGLRKSYGRVEVLHGVELKVAAGERVALMGRSGSGKSTLLNCICGIEPFASGSIHLAGKALERMTESELEAMRRLRIGYVFQSFHLLPTLTALENVEFPAQLAGAARAERQQRAEALLERVGLLNRAHHRPDALSGGERQRVALARAVMNRPPLILADEPTGSLDSKNGDQVLGLLEEVSRDEGIAVLLVTHDANTARVCQRVVHMEDGRLSGQPV